MCCGWFLLMETFAGDQKIYDAAMCVLPREKQTCNKSEEANYVLLKHM